MIDMDLNAVIGVLQRMLFGADEREVEAAKREWAVMCVGTNIGTLNALRSVYQTGAAHGIAYVMVAAKDRCDTFEERVRAETVLATKDKPS